MHTKNTKYISIRNSMLVVNLTHLYAVLVENQIPTFDIQSFQYKYLILEAPELEVSLQLKIAKLIAFKIETFVICEPCIAQMFLDVVW